MSEAAFNQRAEQVLSRIEQALDDADLDADIQRSGNVLEIEFDDGQKIVINRHDPSREIWVAARSGAYHFAWDGNLWHSARNDKELYAVLGELCAQYGAPVTF